MSSVRMVRCHDCKRMTMMWKTLEIEYRYKDNDSALNMKLLMKEERKVCLICLEKYKKKGE